MFVALFIIGAPKIVFYALGYSYKIGSEKGIVQTGLIYLSSTPPGATVYIGGRRYREPTPAIIRDLLPGNYPIRLVLKDHETWSKSVPIEAAKASVLGKILLNPKKPEWRKRVLDRFEDLIVVPDTRYLLLRKSDQLDAVQIYDWKQGKASSLFVGGAEKESQFSSVSVASGSPHVLFKVESKKKKRWIWIDLDKGEKSKITWGDEIPFQSDKLVWSEKDSRYLFTYYQGSVSRFDVEKKTLVPMGEPVQGFGVNEKKLLLLTNDNQFKKTDFFDKNSKVMIKNANLLKALASENDPFEVKRVASDIVFYLSGAGTLLMHQGKTLISEKDILGFHFDKKHRKAVLWRADAIGIIQFLKDEEGDVLRPSAKVEWILKGARQLRHVYWAHDGAYLIFQDQNKIFLLELETFGSPSVHELLETKSDSQIFYSDDSGELFYLDKKTGNLMSLEVIPKWKVLEVPFSILQEKEKEGKVAA